MSYIVVIPARYQSTRLPGKPLIDINGIPMVIRTYNQCKKAVSEKKIFVATDNKRIEKICEKSNIKTIMTSSRCLTGTDRIAEVSKKIKVDNYINIQGDEPIFSPNDIKKLIKFTTKFPKEIINGYCKIENESMFRSGHVPKVVFRNDGKLFYMSRAPIPTTKKHKYLTAWRQVCAYSIPKKALMTFSAIKKKTLLEKIEDCELLRFIELGFEIRMIKMSNKSVAVDTKEDLRQVRNILKKK